MQRGLGWDRCRRGITQIYNAGANRPTIHDSTFHFSNSSFESLERSMSNLASATAFQGNFDVMIEFDATRFCNHFDIVSIILFSRKCAVVVRSFRLLRSEVSWHGWGNTHATFQLQWRAEPNVFDDQRFDMLAVNSVMATDNKTCQNICRRSSPTSSAPLGDVKPWPG